MSKTVSQSRFIEHPNVNCLSSNPLIKHKITLLRDKTTSPKDFREILEEMTFILAVEAAKHVKYVEKRVFTPMAEYPGIKINVTTVVSIIRAGLGMMSPMLKLFPNCIQGFMGVARNEETLEPQIYYRNIPSVPKDSTTFLLDPMLASGGSLCVTLDEVVRQGAKDIVVLCILSTPQGIERVLKAYPHVIIYTAEIDETLSDTGFIVPGLGDAGDRIFNTVECKRLIN